MTEAEVARTLRGSRFFLSTSVQEGFGLPPLEAMGCGCLVIGFTGGGGDEFASTENGFWVEDQNTQALADEVERVLSLYRQNPDHPRWKEKQKAAEKSAGLYSFKNQKQALLETWNHLLSS
jgi:glycosyltransferase involved in cell wall biosynthesis